MIWSVPTEQSFSVDPEVCAFFEDYELERLLEQFDRGIFINGVTEGYKNYVYRNVLVLSHAQNLEHDMFCRRTEHKQRLGLTIDYDIDALVAKTVSFAAMPNDARKAWAHKASTATAQTDLWENGTYFGRHA
jgi:Leu/Phe-tRNA-protein transferase